MKKSAFALLATLLLACVVQPAVAVQTAQPTPVPAPATEKATAAVAATVNVNTASAAELQSLPGIGVKTAENIVAYRTEKGRFKNTRELLRVKGIGSKTFEKIKNLVSIE